MYCECGAIKESKGAGVRRKKCRSFYVYGQCRDSVCAKCGFEAEHQTQMDIHHLNGDHKDNRAENLVTYCANCHRLEHIDVS